MSTITKEWLQQKIADMEAIRDDIPFGLGEDGTNTLAALRIALASLEAEPYGYVHKAAYEQAGSCGLSNDREAYRDSSTHVAVYTSPPAPVSVPAAMEMDDDFDSAFEHGKAAGWNACRAAMLQRAEPVSQPYTLRDGWVAVPVEMTPEQMRAVQLNSELGAYATANLSGAYSLFREFWDVAVKSAPNQEAK